MKLRERELIWGTPRLEPSMCYGSHDPVSLDGGVVCAACGAKAQSKEASIYPEADDELRDLLTDKEQ